METNDKIKLRPDPYVPSSPQDRGFDKYGQRKRDQGDKNIIGGAEFNTLLSEMLFNRMIKLKNIPGSTPPQGNEPGKIYWDKDNKKYKLYVDDTVKFVDVMWSSTSTSTTSSSSSSSSTSSTSTSTT